MNQEQQLNAFVEWWRQYCTGDEKGQAQVFLDRLFQAFGQGGVQEAGGKFEERIKRQREGKTSTAFADLVVPDLVLIEMKKRGEDLRKHYAQAFDYWLNLTPYKPKYVILCNFDEFWVYELDHQLEEPRDKVRVEELPDRWGPLAFLYPKDNPANKKVVFESDLVAVTQEAADSMAQLFNMLTRRGIKIEQAQRYVLQCMLALFAEDIELLPRYTFTQVIEDCLNGENNHDVIWLLFLSMNQPGVTPSGRFKGVPYFDGGIFSIIDPVELTTSELEHLRNATRHDWAKIRPAIFGTLFEHSMGAEERHQVGAHYTTEADIQRIIQPVITRPWRDRIEAATTVDQLRSLQGELAQYQVIDPACGSGNFLYLAYREMKRLEKEILDRIQALGGEIQTEIGLVNARQFWGFDIKPFAVELAKVTLMIGKKLAVDELHLPENALPLDNLDDNIRVGDALFEAWHEFDACIGNPPYLGAKRLKIERGVNYVNEVRAAFPDVPGNADYCVYWFRKAHDLMKPGSRAGLVGTNTIRQNYSREGGLDYIVNNGGTIFEAVSSLAWSGEAAVSISIACWSKGEPPFRPARLWLNEGQDVHEVERISSSLSIKPDVVSAKTLAINADQKRVFQGQTPGHAGFVLTESEAKELIRKDGSSKTVIFPYLTGDDLLGNVGAKPGRYIIDFEGRDKIAALPFKAVYKRLEKLVLPDKKANADAEREKNRLAFKVDPKAHINHDHKNAFSKWWLHFRERVDLKEAARDLKRYIICSRISKRPVFDFISTHIKLSDKVQIFVFEDDYSFGILQSNLHWEWWLAKGGTLTERPAYTPHSIFDTFPFPQNSTPTQVKAVAEAARKLHEYRREMMTRNGGLTLREMYRSLEQPGKNPLADLHAALDKAVMTAYGFDPKREVLSQLLELNLQVAERIEAGEPVTAPGIPPNYPNPAELVSEGCIHAPEL